jgi:hypothetical protein
MMANPFQGDDEDPFSGVRDKEGNIKQVGLAKSAIPKSDAPKSDAPKSAAPKKNRIVTKEELKKSGFTNLRDFLNAERGLKRRDGKPAERGPDKATLDRISRNLADADKGPDKATLDRISRNLADADKGPDKATLDRGAAAVKKIKADEAAAKNKSADRPGSEVLAEKMEKGQPKMQGAYREAFGNIRKALGFKKGGNVESKLMGKEGRGMAKATMQKVASKAVKGHESRMHKAKPIDGIALRGKTRGRMR